MALRLPPLSGLRLFEAAARCGSFKRAAQELDLTPDQTQQLTEIINDSFQKHRALDQQVGEEYRALRNETRGRIRKILNPAQQAKFDELVRRFEQKRPSGPPGPPS